MEAGREFWPFRQLLLSRIYTARSRLEEMFVLLVDYQKMKMSLKCRLFGMEFQISISGSKGVYAYFWKGNFDGGCEKKATVI